MLRPKDDVKSQLLNSKQIMFDFITSVIIPQVTNILRDLALAVCAALLTWAINKVQTQFN
jgi:hypothetical protein